MTTHRFTPLPLLALTCASALALTALAIGCTAQSPKTAPDSSTLNGSQTPTPSASLFSPPLEAVSGRVLVNVEAAEQPSQPVFIDAHGVHVLPDAGGDATLAHTVWASPTPQPSPTSPRRKPWRWERRYDSLVFDSDRAGPRHLFRLTPSGEVIQVTSGRFSQDSASVSPDGEWLAYGEYLVEGEAIHDRGLHTSRIDGSEPRGLTRAAPPGSMRTADDPTFSPDGALIAFVQGVEGSGRGFRLMVVGADGEGLRTLVGPRFDAAYPRWSPDGSQILFTAHSHVGSGHPQPLFAVDASGGPARPLTRTDAAGSATEGDWSPDGAQVVFKYYEDGWDHNELRLVNADGTDERILWVSPSGTTAETPDWGN